MENPDGNILRVIDSHFVAECQGPLGFLAGNKTLEGHIARVEELPGTNTQGATLADARENLVEAVMMALEANHELAGTPVPEEFSLNEKISLAAA